MAKSLYDKYGGFAGISAVVGKFYEKIGKSKTLEHYFKDTDMANLIDHQTKFLCTALGGPNNYEGNSLEKAHKKLKITKEAFGEVAGYLKESLEEAGVEASDVTTVINLVASLADQVITA